MFEFIHNYSLNKGKLFDFGIEALYTFTLLFLAVQLYGQEVSLDSFISDAKSLSIHFVENVIGIGLTYLFVTFMALTIIVVTTMIGSELIMYISYLTLKRGVKESANLGFTFVKFKKQEQSKIMDNEVAYRMFDNLNEKQFNRNKEIFFNKLVTTQLGQIFVILLAYLIIHLFIQENSSFGIMDGFIIPILILIVFFYHYASQVEETVGHSDFFLTVEEQNRVKELSRMILRNKHCYQKNVIERKKTVIENFFFVFNKDKVIVAWIIIIDRDFMHSALNDSTSSSIDNLNKTFKIIIDVFDLLPDRYSQEENLKVVKSLDEFNLDKEVNNLLTND